MENKQDLKGGEIEKEDLNNCDYIENYEKEGEMVGKSKKKPAKKKKKPKIKISGSYKKRRRG